MAQVTVLKLISLLLLLWATCAQAARRSTSVVCFTTRASTKPASVVTSSSTARGVSRTTFTVSSTTTTSETETPDPVIVRETSTSSDVTTVTQSTKTDTFFSTKTEVATETSTTTLINTSTATASTTTTITAFSTVPTVAGFTPLASNADVVANTVTFKKFRVRGQEKSAATPAPWAKPRYQAAVNCVEYHYLVTSTTRMFQSTVTTTLTPETSVSTVIEHKTSTVTEAPPDASTTTTTTVSSTTTTTSATSSTSTVTSTTTQTANTVVTAYDACRTNNILDKVGTHYVGGALIQGGDQDVDATNAADCCAKCQTTAGCEGYQYANYAHSPSYNSCVLFSSSKQCNPQNTGSWSFTTYKNGPDNPYGYPDLIYGNGPCGQGNFGGYCSFCGTG